MTTKREKYRVHEMDGHNIYRWWEVYGREEAKALALSVADGTAAVSSVEVRDEDGNVVARYSRADGREAVCLMWEAGGPVIYDSLPCFVRELRLFEEAHPHMR